MKTVEELNAEAPPQPKPPKFRVKAVTVNCEISNKDYGNGDSGSASISAWVVDDSSIEDTIDAALDLYLAAWSAVILGKIAAKLLPMTADDLRDTLAKIRKRAEKVRAIFRETSIEKTEVQP